ncbi:hypothetical protein ABBQ38_011128 [Trebouxia sp. C0009 RCD-2024]
MGLQNCQKRQNPERTSAIPGQAARQADQAGLHCESKERLAEQKGEEAEPALADATKLHQQALEAAIQNEGGEADRALGQHGWTLPAVVPSYSLFHTPTQQP